MIRPRSGVLDFNLKELIHHKFLGSYSCDETSYRNSSKQYSDRSGWRFSLFSRLESTASFLAAWRRSRPTEYRSLCFIWRGLYSGLLLFLLAGSTSVISSNAGLFSKIYFPRLVVPITTAVTRLYTFVIQIIIFIIIYAVYVFRGAEMRPNLFLLLVPVVITHAALLGLGVGLWVNALTVKYRDLVQLVGFGVSLWMWATPIVYPLSLVPQKYRFLIYFNPMAPVVELFRYAFTGAGAFRGLPYSRA